MDTISGLVEPIHLEERVRRECTLVGEENGHGVDTCVAKKRILMMQDTCLYFWANTATVHKVFYHTRRRMRETERKERGRRGKEERKKNEEGEWESKKETEERSYAIRI